MRVYASAEMTLTDTSDGISVTGIDRYYMASSYSSGITVDSSGWKPDPQETNQLSRYHWSYEVVNYSSGPPVPSKPAIIGVYGKDGVAGKDSIVGYLTNESVTLGASSTGVVSSFATASGTFRVFDGITEVTTNSACVFSLNSSTGVTLTINSSGVYTVTAMSADTATAEFKAVYKGITITKSMSLSKSRVGPQGIQGPQGATGSQGPRGNTGTSVESITEYYLATSASSDILATDTRFTTTMQSMTATNKYLWNYEKINFSDGTSQPTIPVIIGVYGDKGQTGGTGATGRSIVSITEHYLATSASTGVTRSTSGWKTTMQPTTETNKYLWNYETINWSSGTTPTYVEPIIIGVHGAKGSTGATGPQGVSPIVGFLTNESITLPASSAGVVPSFTGATGTFNVYQGTVLRNASATYSVVSQSGITVSITQSGVYTVTAMTTGTSVLSGTATLRAVYGGVTVDKILAVTKALAGSQGATGATGGTGATGSAGQNATTYWINASTNAIKKDVAGTIVPSTITFSGFSKTGTSNPVAYAGRFIIQTSTDGVSYTTAYTSSANQASYTYTVPTTASFVKARYYLAGGTSILLDEQTVPVLVDAEGIEIGGRNLYLGSGKEVTSSGYNISEYKFANKPIAGEKYTLSIKGKINPEHHTGFYTNIFNGTAHPAMATVGSEDLGSDGVYRKTFTMPHSADYISTILYSYPLGKMVEASVEWIKLEKGNIATDWTEAPEDVQERIGNKADIESVTEVSTSLNSNIEIAMGEFKTQVSETYVEKTALDTYKEEISTQFSQTSTSFDFSFNELFSRVNNLSTETKEDIQNIEKYIRFVDGKIVLGQTNNQLVLQIANDKISFLQFGSEVAYFSNNKLFITDVEVLNSIKIGNFAFLPRANGSLDFKKI